MGVETTVQSLDSSDRDFIVWLNRGARSGAVVDTIHGVEVADPYRLLELDTPVTRAWIEGQTARTERLIAPHIAEAHRERIDELMNIGTLAKSHLAGERIFYLRRGDSQEQAILYVRESTENGNQTTRVLLDPTDLGPRIAIDWYFPSPNGQFVAVGLSKNGDERSVLHLIDVETAELTRSEERIEHCRWTTVSWLNDTSGFYYVRYPREGEPNFNVAELDSYYPRVFFHRLGTNPDEDLLVYGAENPEDHPTPAVSDDDQWLVINVSRGWSNSDVLLINRTVGAESDPVEVSVGCDCLIYGAVRHGQLFLHTNENHPRYRLMVVAPEQAAERSQWREIIPESDAILEGWGATQDRLVLYEMRNFASHIRLTSLEGDPAGELELPTNGSLNGLSMQPTSNRTVFVFSSFFYPPTLFEADVSSGGVQQIEQVETDFDVEPYEITQTSVASEDGTPVNVFLVHRRDAQQDGSNRVLLYGYGGFNISMLPSLSRSVLFWLEQGGVYAVANIRGGGELGESWHQAGQLEHKHRVFEDFEAVIRWLSSSNWSRPEGIAIMGGSNGGLLVGATLNRCPEAFAAAVSYVGLYDMVRYHRFPPGGQWVSEYGSSENAEQFHYLYEYSPYHNVRIGVTYPATLIETADQDTRVYWGHSTKFTARLQEAATNPDDIFFYMERSVGHGAGTRRSDIVNQTVRLFAFLMWRLFEHNAPNGSEGEE